VQNSGKSGRGVKTMKSKEDGIASRETHENPAQGETRKVKRSLSPESRKRISDAQKKHWAALRPPLQAILLPASGDDSELITVVLVD
jgi:hypothetical protein